MPLTVGVDVGGTKCLALALDSHDRVVGEARVPTPRGSDELIEAVVGVVEEVSADAAHPRVGIGVPGLVDADGFLAFVPNLPGVVDLPLRRELEARLGAPVHVENDATAAAWGEREVGAGKGADHMLLVTLGTGIGGGLVLGGSLYRGANGYAGEIGHMIVDPDGPQCPCGKRGCWERFASGSALGRLARESGTTTDLAAIVALAGGDVGAVRGEHVTTAAGRGDAGALAILTEYAGWLALGLVNLTNLYDPELFVIGGGVVEAADVLLEPTRRAVDTLLGGAAHRPPVRIVAAGLGENAGAIGAALLARD